MRIRQHPGIHWTLAWAIAFLYTATTNGFAPPDHSSGSLHARIEGPSQITETQTPLVVQVVLSNQGDHPIEGAIQIGVIDDWTTQPEEPVRFQVKPQETIRYRFQVRAAKGSYSGHYPIHAFVRFDDQGAQRVVHPVLIVKTKLVDRSQPIRKGPKGPLKLAANGSLLLWQSPARRGIVQVFGQEPIMMPHDFRGEEPYSRARVEVHTQELAGANRQVIALHPPWRDRRVGTIAVEYPVVLPDSQPIHLTFANAIDPEGQSDGVTFRVRVTTLSAPKGTLGTVEYERHVQAKSWQDVNLDLSKFAGQAIRLQLESHPGPRNNTAWDYSFWAEPTLTAGAPPSDGPKMSMEDTSPHRLGTTESGNHRFEIQFQPGVRGALDGIMTIRDGLRQLEAQGFEVTVLGTRIDDPRSPIRLTRVLKTTVDGGLQLRHFFQSAQGPFELVAWVGIDRNVLRARFRVENAPAPQPWIHARLEDVAVGRWSHSVTQVYAGMGNVVTHPEAYRLEFDGHRLATSFVGYEFASGFSLVEGVDAPPRHLEVQPERQHASLHVSDTQTRTLIPTPNVWEGVKQWRQVNNLKAAGGVKKAAGRFVFDLWGGRYGEQADQLERAFQYGLTDAMVVLHNWQRWGYDYRLPEIFPPNPRFGTTEELSDLIQTCRRAGVLLALHDNYIDIYPDAEGFSYKKAVAFREDGTPVPAWLNRERAAQSYRFRPDQVGPFLKANLRQIGQELKPSAHFIDVWSSIRPYEYWTAEGTYATATSSRNTWRELLAWTRDFLGEDAPQISESGHDQLIGWLDGAQTNHLRVGPQQPGDDGHFVWDWKCADAERVPWYDAAHHDRFALHGAGYDGRFAAGLDRREHGIYSDDYLATEVLTGHPAMVSRAFGRDVVRKYWLTHDLMRALAGRRIESVEFVGEDIHRQRVRWTGGAEVWVNRGTKPWPVEDIMLPQFGFLARVPTPEGDVTASVQQLGDVIVESVRSSKQWYVNKRPNLGSRQQHSRPVDWRGSTIGGGCRFAPQGDQLVITPLPFTTAPGFDITLDWTSLPWTLPIPSQVETIDHMGTTLPRIPIRRNGNRFVIHCDADAFAYRLTHNR